MDALIFATGAVMPIILIVAVGYILKRIGFMTEQFSIMANRLVFYVFLPCMLFLGVYKIEDVGGISLGFVGYALLAELCVVLVSFAVIILNFFFTKFVTFAKKKKPSTDANDGI